MIVTWMVRMLFLMFLLAVNGEPLRYFVFRRLKLFSNPDFLQICILDIYLGGFILYIIAILPFQLFSWTIIFCVTSGSLLLSVFICLRELIRRVQFNKFPAPSKEKRRVLLDYMAVLAMFLVFFTVNLAALDGLVFGSVHDESIHSLMTQVILENSCIPLTLQPYLPEGIIYPQASHVIFAFASYMFNIEEPESVLHVSALFKSLSVLGAYFLGKEIGSHRKHYLSISFVFAFISSWPLYISWGGNPFIVGFPLFLICLGLLFFLIHTPGEKSLIELAAIGLLFGYAGTLIISYLQTLIAIMACVFIYRLFRRHNYIRYYLFEFFVVFLVSLLVLSPFVLRFFMFYQFPGHNIGLPSDFSGWPKQQFVITQALQWAFENLSPHLLLRLTVMLILAIFSIMIWKTKDYKDIVPICVFALTIFIATALLSFIAFFLPADFDVVSWGHQGILLVVPINIIIAVFYTKVVDKFCNWHKNVLDLLTKKTWRKLWPIFLFLLFTSPFLYYRILIDPTSLNNAYKLFAVTSQDDYNLMVWMRENLPSDALILVNRYDAGLFIPSVSNHRIIFPYSGSGLSRSYQTLINMLRVGVVNETTYELMQYWNISHIFVGSHSTYWWREHLEWDPQLFLGNPNFILTKRSGDAYLFELCSNINPNILFYDDFEHLHWNDYGWEKYLIGNGSGDIMITTSTLFNDSRCLTITAQTKHESEHGYAVKIRRKIFAPEGSSIVLSIYLEATKGFNEKDEFAITISNVSHNQSLVITTTNGGYKNNEHVILLDLSDEIFELNLSKEWQQSFNSVLPNPFILELTNYDFDGIKNVAYIDDIKIECTSS